MSIICRSFLPPASEPSEPITVVIQHRHSGSSLGVAKVALCGVAKVDATSR